MLSPSNKLHGNRWIYSCCILVFETYWDILTDVSRSTTIQVTVFKLTTKSSLQGVSMVVKDFTKEVPDENILEEPGRFETMLENLLQSPDKAILATEEKGQTASLHRVTTTRRCVNLGLIKVN